MRIFVPFTAMMITVSTTLLVVMKGFVNVQYLVNELKLNKNICFDRHGVDSY